MNFLKKNHELKKNNRKCVSKHIITLLIALLISISTFAQQGINYKALIKDASGNVINNQTINVRFTIQKNNGTGIYSETHTTMADANGIIIVNIGEGIVESGDFSNFKTLKK